VTETAGEQFSAFFNMVLMAAIGAFTALGERLKPGGAFGPCVLVGQAAYMAVGGHRQVSGAVLEDIPLGRLFLRQSLPVRCLAGRGLIHFRMYPGGWRQMLQGWTKGMAYGAVSVSPLGAVLAGAWITGCFGAVSGLIGPVAATGLPSAIGLVMYGAYVLLIWAVLRQVGRFDWWVAVFFPAPLIFFALVVLRSFIATYALRRLNWRGRSMRVGGPGGEDGCA
jgi:4,4'-diaponeurosporenoate glycosyltransferase